MELLICHLLGDYVLQNHWMATNKVRAWFHAIVHATVYILQFLLLSQSVMALAVMWSTHAVIDRYRLAGYWTRFYKIGTGAPDWLAVWLLIIMDNTFHMTINYLSVKYL